MRNHDCVSSWNRLVQIALVSHVCARFSLKGLLRRFRDSRSLPELVEESRPVCDLRFRGNFHEIKSDYISSLRLAGGTQDQCGPGRDQQRPGSL